MLIVVGRRLGRRGSPADVFVVDLDDLFTRSLVASGLFAVDRIGHALAWSAGGLSIIAAHEISTSN